MSIEAFLLESKAMFNDYMRNDVASGRLAKTAKRFGLL